jgi:hypothetical protein
MRYSVSTAAMRSGAGLVLTSFVEAAVATSSVAVQDATVSRVAVVMIDSMHDGFVDTINCGSGDESCSNERRG